MQYLVLYQTFRGISIFLTIVGYILMAYCILSWFVRPNNGLFRFLSRMAQPLLAPFRPIARKLMEHGFMVDISAILAFLALRILDRLLWMLFSYMI